MKLLNYIMKRLIQGEAPHTPPMRGETKSRMHRNTISVMLVAFITLFFSSCDMINEDLQPCAPAPNIYTTVDFVYDYNMEFTDLFKEHVGSVYLYVFDQDSLFVMRHGVRKAEMSGDKVDFTMQFDTTVFKPGNTYYLLAMANGNHRGYTASTEETPGFVKTDLEVGVSKISDYIIKLDRDEDGDVDFGVVNYKDTYGNNQQMIDTVWSTKPDEVRTIRIPSMTYVPSAEKQPDYYAPPVEIPMMRLTNAITVNLLSSAFDETTDTEAYTCLIFFPSGNGTIDFTGTVYPYQPLYYRTLRKYMAEYLPQWEQQTKADNKQYALRAEFGVSRLLINDESSFQVRDSATGELIYEIPDFSKYLAEIFEQNGVYGQDLLDRMYDFEIDITLKQPTPPDDPSDNWMYIDIMVDNWHVRINNIGF